MVIDGRSSSPEAICFRSGAVVTILANEVFVCLNGVMAASLRNLSRPSFSVPGSLTIENASFDSGSGGDRLLALNSVKAVLPTKRQETVVGRSQVRNAISPRNRVIPVTVDRLEPRRMIYENPRGVGQED